MAVLTTAVLVNIAISIAISAALSIGMRLLSSLLNQGAHQQQYGGQLQRADPGTQLTLRESGAAQRIVFGTRRVPGTIVFAHCTENNALLHLVIAWAGHEIDSFGALYFGDELIALDNPGAGHPTGRFNGYCSVWDHLGTADQDANGALIAYAPDLWTTNHRGRGIAYSYINLRWNAERFGQFSIDKIWRVVSGMKVYDPRDATTGYSDNAALCVAAWMNSAKFGRAVPYDEIDSAELEAAANVCDETVALADGSSEKRYTCHAVLSSDTPFVDNLTKLLSASHGEMMLIGDQWRIQAGAWEAPELVFDEGDFRAAFTMTNGIGRDGFNAIKGKFANPAKNYQLDDFPAITSAAYEIEDGGDGTGLGRVFQDVHLECTTSASMAQRIVRIDLRTARQPLAFTAQLKLKGLRAVTGKNVAITFDMLGWAEKAFKVKRMRLVPGFGPGGQPGVIGVDLDLIETGEFIYDWTASDEIARDPIPDTNFPDVFGTLPPANLTAVEGLYVSRDGGGVKAKVTLSCAASPDAFVQSGGEYQFERLLSGDAAWTVLGRSSVATFIDTDVTPGTYEYRVAAINWAGVLSTYITTTLPVVGLAALPAAPTGLSINAAGGLAIVRYDKTPDLDVEIGGSIVFRHSAMLSGATWADAVSIADPQPGNLTVAILPLKAGTYLAKFADSGGRFSTGFASFVQTQASVHTFSPLAGGSLVEDPGFTGTKTDVSALGGVLKLGGAGLFSDIPLLSAVASVAYWGDVRPSGAYDFSGPIDLGSVKRCRLTVGMSSHVVNVFDLVGSRTAPISTWASFVGDVSGEEADARVEVRTTQTDPAGAPVWTEWARLDAGEFQARGFEFRALLESLDPSFDIEISALAVVAEGV